MNKKELSTSIPNPNPREDDTHKAEAIRRGAEYSRAVAEASRESAETRREGAEQERIVSEDSRQVSEVDRRAAEEHRRSAEELRQAAKETHGAAEDLRAAAEEAKEVLEEAKQAQKNGEASDFDRMPEGEIGGGMGIQLQMEQMSGYLAARFTGVGAPPEGSQQAELIAEHCKRTNNDKLLVDTTGVALKISLADRFFAGKRWRIFAGYRIKVAFVSRPEQIDPGKFAILVAQNRGVTVETFTDFQAAEEWLLK